MTVSGASTSALPVPTDARAVAARLAALFTSDQRIVAKLNHAQQRLQAANERLRTHGARIDGGEAHWQIHGAFCDYQHAAEQRRQLAVDVGERSHQLTDLLQVAGWSIEQARSANVHQLATAPAGPATDARASARSGR
jgi:hypothetical protein